jgi:hypothetical protein
MNFYLSAIDDLLRHPADQPGIGVILCRSKSSVVAEYALRDTAKPIGISKYLATVSLPADLKGSIPTIEDLEAELKRATHGIQQKAAGSRSGSVRLVAL